MELTKGYTITLDDDPMMHKIVSRMTGVKSLPFSCPKTLLKQAQLYQPTAVFLDIHLDFDLSGLDFIPSLRKVWHFVPIIVMTDDPTARLIGQALALGANDFVRKPLNQEELIGRLQARISEMNSRSEVQELKIFDVIFNKHYNSLKKNDQIVYLANLESKLLQSLAEHQGMVVSKEVLKANLWGKTTVSENAFHTKISSLRRSLKDIDAGFTVRSIYGGGVSLVVDHSMKKAS